MSNRADAIAEANLEQMERCRRIARELGFAQDGSSIGLVHESGLAVLYVTDPEVSWRLSVRERCAKHYAPGYYFVETGSIDLSNLTPSQFRSVLSAVVAGFGRGGGSGE